MNLINLGCGATFHPDWINLDLKPPDGGIQHDLYEPLPFENDFAQVIYCSHVLEHLHKRFAPLFLQECYRVLCPGGMIRIVVPDLEVIATLYLNALHRSIAGDARAQNEYEWAVIELIDQLSRHRSGGEMGEYWKLNPMPAESYVLRRMGQEAKRNVDRFRKINAEPRPAIGLPVAYETDPGYVGEFRLSGQPHLWMYDKYSLGRLLSQSGFEQIEITNATYSYVVNWYSYNLDTDADGRERKPDSLYMEGIKV